MITVRVRTHSVELTRQARDLKKKEAEIAAFRAGLKELWNHLAVWPHPLRPADIQARILMIETEAFTASMGG
jgi:hypothetical protein